MCDLRNILDGGGVDVSTFEWLRPAEGIGLLRTSGRAAIALWNRLRELTVTSHHYPVLIGTPDEMCRLEENAEALQEDGTVQAPPSPFDVTAWAEQALAERLGILRGPPPHERLVARWERYVSLIRGESEIEWNDRRSPRTAFEIPFNYRAREFQPEIRIALVPTEVPWELPLLLRFGGWNDCPEPHVHAAVIRAWNERYGAEPVGMAADRIEMRVARPPTDRRDAVRLATEHIAYCHYAMGEEGDIEELAAELCGGTVWFFWWD